MLSRKEIEERLAALQSSEACERAAAWGVQSYQSREIKALEAAQQLAEWLEGFAHWADLACACDSAERARDEAVAWLEDS